VEEIEHKSRDNKLVDIMSPSLGTRVQRDHDEQLDSPIIVP
jgi:hypothetical protein